MKRYFNIFHQWVLALATGVAMCGCSFLDVDPELGMTDQEVFGTLKNFKMYFNTVYYGTKSGCENNVLLGVPLYLDMSSGHHTFDSTTDASDSGGLNDSQQQFKVCNMTQNTLGAWSFTYNSTNNYRPIAAAMFNMIRVCNKSIANIDKLSNANDEEKNDLLGQAHFVRAYAHFVLVRYFGGMPYIDYVFTGNDEWDVARLTAHETLVKAAADFELAYEYLKKAGKLRRDAAPGTAGHLESAEMFIPNGATAKAMRARALLYAASQANNRNGAADWEDAAKACGEAITVAQDCGYALLPLSNYNDNFYGVAYTNESLWTWSYGTTLGSGVDFAGLLAYPQSNNGKAGGICPTQNFVDRFETANGDPLLTEADRTAAVAAGHYNEQNPYANRDPRFYKDVVFDGMTIPEFISGPVNIYYDPATKSYPTTACITTVGIEPRPFGISWGSKDSNNGSSNTGYYCKKFWNGSCGTHGVRYPHSDPIIRIAELYLNYAEATNEAYGPNGTAGGCTLTALEAVNTVRTRAEMPNIDSKYTAGTELLRERIRNERCVELAFEGHHYYSDIRRWQIAPQTMTQTLMGMYIESCSINAEHPVGRLYQRSAIPANRQSTWRECMYYLPFPDAQARTMSNFVNNEKWQ